MLVVNNFLQAFFIWVCFWAHFSSAKLLSGVFTSIDSITANENNVKPHINEPYSHWNVALNWQITPAMNAQTGDTFQLSMPGVAHTINTYSISS